VWRGHKSFFDAHLAQVMDVKIVDLNEVLEAVDVASGP